MRRSLLLLIAVLAIPVATALAAFGDPEVADPKFFVNDTIPDQLQVDNAGRAYFASIADGKALAKKKLKAGTRKLALKPKKKLKRGRHTLTANAVDAAGNRAKTLKKRFRVQ